MKVSLFPIFLFLYWCKLSLSCCRAEQITIFYKGRLWWYHYGLFILQHNWRRYENIINFLRAWS